MFVLLGDYIDRGPESAGVVRYLIESAVAAAGAVDRAQGQPRGDGARRHRRRRRRRSFWLMQGGAETLRSYGVAAAGELPRAHVDWLRSLPLSYDDGRRFFVHAGIDPDKPLDAQDERDLHLDQGTVPLRRPRPWPPDRARSHAAETAYAGSAQQPAQPRHRRRVRRPVDGGGVCRRRDEPIAFLQAE